MRALARLAPLALLFCTACPTTPAECPEQFPANFAWEILFETDVMHGALFSVWGTSAQDVWTVGATDKDKPAFGPQVLHWDGNTWKRFKTGATGELWWITPGYPAGTLWMVGSGGTIVRYDGKAFEVQQAPDNTQLFGIQAFAPNDVWAVGGPSSCTAGSGTCGVIWHYDGSKWQPAPGMSAALRGKVLWFKVWGRSPSDVWIVGGQGHTLHFDGKTWTEVPTPTTDQIFTVHGNATLTVAVGGLGAGVLLENTGDGWKTAKINGDPQGFNGIHVPADGRAIAVGGNGTVWRRCGGVWSEETHAPEALEDYHAVWKSATGEVYAVGGAIVAPPFAGGQIGHFGVKTNAHSIAE